MTKDKLIERTNYHMNEDAANWTLADRNFMLAMIEIVDNELRATGSTDELKKIMSELTPYRQQWAGEIIDTFAHLLQK